MTWFPAWRRRAVRLFLLIVVATAAVNLVQFILHRDYDLELVKTRLAQLERIATEHDAADSDEQWERRLRSWADERGLRAALLRADGSIRLESHPGQSIQPLISGLDLATPSRFGLATFAPTASPSELPQVLAVARRKNSDATLAYLCVAMHRSARPTLRMLFPVWWTAILAFGICAALLAWQMRSADLTKQRFAQAAREFSVGRIQDSPVVISRDPEWRELSDAFSEMESNLGQRDRLMEEDRLRVQAVLTSMVEGVLAIDADQRIMVANQSAIDMLSLHSDSVVGRFAGEVVRHPGFEESLVRARASGQSVQSEFETVGPRRRMLSMRVTPIVTRGTTELAVVLYDTTDLRRLETMRRDFVANVSHELKTPLAAIKAYAETLRMGAIDDQENNRRFLEQIEIHADILERQVRDLMHLARVESGRAAFEISNVDLDQACHECLARFQDEANRREVRLSFSPQSPATIVRADREAIQTVLDNLVSNAIRYTRPGGFVAISTAREGNSGVLAVVDNGIGIAPEHQSRIFERFYRVDKARSRDVGGTGLGLSIVKHTVQALGGQIELTSSIGRGSTFRVLLPLAS